MKRIVFSLMLFSFCGIYAETKEYWKLVWSEEFEYVGLPDSEKWNFEEGFRRNNEAQWYQPQNASVKNGYLTLEARRDLFKNPNYLHGHNDWRRSRREVNYTSASINTRGKFEFQYGRLEVRAKIPTASGSWPAIWTLGREMTWPSNGEIDIMEYYQVNGEPTILANAAWGSDKPFNAIWKSSKHPYSKFIEKDPKWAEKAHTWRMDWDSIAIRLYLDDELLNEIFLKNTNNGKDGNYKNPFKQPHYILLNLALGGDNGGKIDNSAFPMKYEIEYVRVFQKDNEPLNTFKPGNVWVDTDGNPIHAHSGGIIYHEDKYYWFGEHKTFLDYLSNDVGVSCYSSTDLLNWKYEGLALETSNDDPKGLLTKGANPERPKVIYNAETKKFVMWFHLELEGKGYEAAMTGCAVSDNITGPYKFVDGFRPNAGKRPFNMSKREYNAIPSNIDEFVAWSPEWKEAVKNGMFLKKDFKGGQMARDMNLFVDDDGKAYHIYSSENNQTLHLAELSSDYLSHTGKYIRIAPGDANEAPAIFKRKGIYWMIASGCTGWDLNEARLFSAKNIWGPWTKHSNPCIGKRSDTTFDSQSTCVIKLQGKEDSYIYMGDRWGGAYDRRLSDNIKYIWLPIEFENETPIIKWHNEWCLNHFDK